MARLHPTLVQQAVRPLLRRAAPEEVHLLLTDLDDVRLDTAHSICSLAAAGLSHRGRRRLGSQLIPFALRFGVGYRRLSGGPGGLLGEAQRSEVEQAALENQLQIHLLRAQAGVRPRLAGKAEGSVPMLIQGDKSRW